MSLHEYPGVIAVMQGRLSPRPPTGLQAFPWTSWESEFALAAALGFDAIEWIHEAPMGDDNPILHREGRALIRQIVDATGVKVRSLCGDTFLRRRLDDPDARRRGAAGALLRSLIDAAADVGASRILLPLLETADPVDHEAQQRLRGTLEACLPAADDAAVTLAFEMEWPGPEYAAFVASFDHPRVRACYDTGNSAAQGFPIGQDVLPVLPLLEAVHIKDRRVGGTSQPLGTGAADLDGFFAALDRVGFSGDLVLQHYFGADHLKDALRSFNTLRSTLARSRREAA